jgi:hypothetical protein
MAPKPFPFGKIRIYTDPTQCQNFFENLKYIHNSQELGLDTLPTKDELSWAIQKCPGNIDGLADVLGLKLDEHFETSTGRICKLFI